MTEMEGLIEATRCVNLLEIVSLPYHEHTPGGYEVSTFNQTFFNLLPASNCPFDCPFSSTTKLPLFGSLQWLRNQEIKKKITFWTEKLKLIRGRRIWSVDKFLKVCEPFDASENLVLEETLGHSYRSTSTLPFLVCNDTSRQSQNNRKPLTRMCQKSIKKSSKRVFANFDSLANIYWST